MTDLFVINGHLLVLLVVTMLGFFACSLTRVTDGYTAMGPLELYEKLTEQGDQVRALKTAKASKVSLNGINCSFVFRKIRRIL